jgi:hypothetical protein
VSGPPRRPPRPFGVTVISIAIGFWGALWGAIGLSEPTTSGTVAAVVGVGALILGVGLFYRHPLSWLGGILGLALGALWFSWGTLEGRAGAEFGVLATVAGAIYLAYRRDAF